MWDRNISFSNILTPYSLTDYVEIARTIETEHYSRIKTFQEQFEIESKELSNQFATIINDIKEKESPTFIVNDKGIKPRP